jgi:hypothetical protein
MIYAQLSKALFLWCHKLIFIKFSKFVVRGKNKKEINLAEKTAYGAEKLVETKLPPA